MNNATLLLYFMCRERFQKCVNYLDKNLNNVSTLKQTHKTRAVIEETRTQIAEVRKILALPKFEVNKVKPIIDEVKYKLFNLILGNKFGIKQGDITNENTDAIVNAANTGLVLGGGVAGAIKQKGGPDVQIACDTIINKRGKPVEIGKVASTAGGNLNPRIIHAAVMEQGGSATSESVRKATRNIILESSKYGYKTLAIPALGAGIGGLSSEESARAIKKGLYDLVLDLIAFDNIKIVANDANTQAIFQRVFNSGS
jgi:O-acetyl-ADP-ribose deacetylase